MEISGLRWLKIEMSVVEVSRCAVFEVARFSDREVTDASIVSLAKFKELETLYLHASGITEHGAKKLKESLPNCHVYR